ncbi:MAG: sigma factor-like helix-turn-helix DNA-binding protein [Candidatus Eremiobacterales bacterium]
MRFYESLSQTEIAKRLDVSQMHVSRLQARALAKLKQSLKVDEG